MQVIILGSAAGGGFPQWNCACRNCRAVRNGNFAGKSRTQAQVAVSADGSSWFLLGASPDLREQINHSAELHPRSLRGSPIGGVLLAGADLDHVLGLLLLRELQPLNVYATASVLHVLRPDNSMFRMLNRVPEQVSWNTIACAQPFRPRLVSGEDAGLSCEALGLSDRYPAYVQNGKTTPQKEAVTGLILTSDAGRSMAYFPNVPQLDEYLIDRLQNVDLLLFDGTFWSDDELVSVQGTGQSAHQMGHMPVGGADGSLDRLRSLSKPQKMYIHINNTNPMLDEAGPQYLGVRNAGWTLAEDGWQVQL